MPKLDLLKFSGFNQKGWLKPLINSMREQTQTLADKVKTSLIQTKQRKELGIAEDPWDNYLSHDAKVLLPLINHQEALSLD